MRQFVVGTGGKNHMSFKAIKANSEVHDNTQLRLPRADARHGQYAWRFVSDPPGGFADAGSGSCH